VVDEWSKLIHGAEGILELFAIAEPTGHIGVTGYGVPVALYRLSALLLPFGILIVDPCVDDVDSLALWTRDSLLPIQSDCLAQQSDEQYDARHLTLHHLSPHRIPSARSGRELMSKEKNLFSARPSVYCFHLTLRIFSSRTSSPLPPAASPILHQYWLLRPRQRRSVRFDKISKFQVEPVYNAYSRKMQKFSSFLSPSFSAVIFILVRTLFPRSGFWKIGFEKVLQQQIIVLIVHESAILNAKCCVLS
jgi:hypothetical protein